MFKMKRANLYQALRIAVQHEEAALILIREKQTHARESAFLYGLKQLMAAMERGEHVEISDS